VIAFPTPGGADALPLFPLRTVLYPGGLLPLKVFEQRYVEMTTGCLKRERPFGVCLLMRGPEVAGADRPEVEVAPVGTYARITSCDVPELGILQVATRGESRFKVETRSTNASGLLVAQVRPIPDEPSLPLPAAYERLAKLLELIATRVGAQHFPSPAYDDASWVGYRLAEVLPLPLTIKQSMLEINDAGVRLEMLQRFCAQQKLLS
jgi:Lon protease-like protein